MPLGLRDLADPVDERQRLHKIVELERPLQAFDPLVLHNLPVPGPKETGIIIA